MAQGLSDTILVAIRITLRIRVSKVRNPDPPDWQRFVLSEHRFLISNVSLAHLTFLYCFPFLIYVSHLACLLSIFMDRIRWMTQIRDD